jgi:transcriptional regulator with XRE-family HTH domain
MARHELTQRQIAELLGITQQSVSLKRKGTTPFTIDGLALVAPLFGVTPAELLAHGKGPRPGRVNDQDGGLSKGRARRDSNPQPSDP